ARVRLLTVEQITALLDDRFRLLTAGHRTAQERHRSLTAAIDWSVQLLSEPERRLFAALSVFAGGFSLEAARWLGAEASTSNDALDLLARLVDKSLVIAETSGREMRYRLLETLRAYGRELLREQSMLDAVLQRHAAFFARLAEMAEP